MNLRILMGIVCIPLFTSNVNVATERALLEQILAKLSEQDKKITALSEDLKYMQKNLKIKHQTVDELALLREELNQVMLLQDSALNPAELVSIISKLDTLIAKAISINGSKAFICEAKFVLACFIAKDKSVNKFKEALAVLQEIEKEVHTSIKHEVLHKIGKYAHILSILCEELKPEYLDIMRAAWIAEQEFIEAQLKNTQIADTERAKYVQALAKSRKALALYCVNIKKRKIELEESPTKRQKSAVTKLK